MKPLPLLPSWLTSSFHDVTLASSWSSSADSATPWSPLSSYPPRSSLPPHSANPHRLSPKDFKRFPKFKFKLFARQIKSSLARFQIKVKRYGNKKDFLNNTRSITGSGVYLNEDQWRRRGWRRKCRRWCCVPDRWTPTSSPPMPPKCSW